MIVLTEKRSDRIGGLRIANPFSGEMEFWSFGCYGNGGSLLS